MRLVSLIVLLFTTIGAYGQLKIDFPYDRMVFQRDNANNGVVHISGMSDLKLDKIEARLVPIQSTQGEMQDWQVIATDIKFGDFVGELPHKGGWYSLELRGVINNQIVSNAKLNHVGIGEVFVVAGQSNAEGFKRFNPKDAQDDRVNCLNYQKFYSISETPEYKDFSHVDGNSKMAPLGDSPWAWGELGDKLAAKLNVPILFFNCGYEGTKLNDWILSIKKIPNHHSGYGFLFENNTPYSYLRIVLQNYCSRLGVRAVFWQQGEADSDTPEDWYASNLKFMIDQTRTDTGKKLSWVVARTSLTFTNKTWQNVINAQNKVINQSDLIFPGPYTDSIQNPRPEGVHFTNEGISDLATAWNKYLPNSFFEQSVPYTASKITTIKGACDGSNNLEIKPIYTYSSYIWSTGASASNVFQNKDNVSLITRDNSGNYYYSQNLNASRYFPATLPSISADANTSFCEGGSVNLTVNNPTGETILWNNSATTQTITVNNSGTFSTHFKNTVGCFSGESNSIATQKIDNPPKPAIVTNVAPLVCDGKDVVASASNKGDNEIFWSTGERSSEIKFTNIGEYAVSAYLKNYFGCQSPVSDTLKVGIKPVPSVPIIYQNGPFALLTSKPENDVQLVWYKDNVKIATTPNALNANVSGAYVVQSQRTYTFNNTQLTCQAEKSAPYMFEIDPNHKTVIVYPNPITDGSVSIASEKELNQVNLLICNMLGVEVYNTQINLDYGPSKIDVSSLSKGIYFVSLLKAGEHWTTRIIIE